MNSQVTRPILKSLTKDLVTLANSIHSLCIKEEHTILCNKTFAQNSVLIIHQRTHTGES